MLNLSPRTKHTKVMFMDTAVSIARVDGAETQLTTGMPAIATF